MKIKQVQILDYTEQDIIEILSQFNLSDSALAMHAKNTFDLLKMNLTHCIVTDLKCVYSLHYKFKSDSRLQSSLDIQEDQTIQFEDLKNIKLDFSIIDCMHFDMYITCLETSKDNKDREFPQEILCTDFTYNNLLEIKNLTDDQLKAIGFKV